MKHSSRRVSRRAILAGAGTAAVAAGLGAAGLSQLAQAQDAVPTSGKFDLTHGSDRLFWKKPLTATTVLQCFAFDNTHGHLYTMQVSNNAKPGDLTVTKLDLTGKKLGRMYLKGFGHGIAFGVQPGGGGVTMWTEAVAKPYGDDVRGTQICRFAFKNTATPITKDDVELFDPFPGNRLAACSLDMDAGTIAVRHQRSGEANTITMFDLAKFAAKDYSAPLASVGTSAAYPPGVTPQGFQHYGQHLYLLQGTAYEGGDKNCKVGHGDGDLDGNVKISRINFNKPSDYETHLTKAGYSLSYREPEGLGVLKVGGKPALALGLASGCPGGRLASIYYKNSYA
ncbi:MAG TPA: hypothetical protein VE172_12230 [Stackebrandtia sp.]|jgi:hypothetical protein|uniref:phage baseplate protein n=1 Tax=Stackebrandtia sp. TaxID=2023065 RepID=UPI002D4BD0F2|nr:hypothetical protein [Stackebrandtia sp.]HZE39568.1 hypothetical protein [Stackebrandtia sp.]